MENSVALVKPKLTSAEKKIIAMVIDGLPSENSRRAYPRETINQTKTQYSLKIETAESNVIEKAKNVLNFTR